MLHQRFLSKWSQSPLLAILFLVVFSGLFFLGLSYLVFGRRERGSAPAPVMTPSTFIYFSRLNGREVAHKEDETPTVVGAMIDNHPEGRPPSGLGEAAVVYEAPVEGGLTRFLAIFAGGQEAARVGPVRSVRPYYLDWLREYGRDALFMYCGGSPAALELMEAEKIFAADEFFNGGYYWRDSRRSAPHNLYTNSEGWQAIFDKYGRDGAGQWTGWKFSATAGEGGAGGEEVKKITIEYFPGYSVEWAYDKESGRYERGVDGERYLDSEGEAIFTDNILVQFTYTKVLDGAGRLEIAAIGRGEGRVLRRGVMVRGYWKKEDVFSRTRFYDKDGAEIALAPGTTWVEIVPGGQSIEVTN